MISSHDELSHTIQDLAKTALGGSNVRDEPRTKLGRSTASKGANADGGDIVEDHQRRGDCLIHGFWQRNTSVVLDFRFGNADASSYVEKDYRDVLATWEAVKKRKHKADCQLNRRHFTPFVSTRDAILGDEANSFTRALAAHLAKKWNKDYSATCGYVKGRIGLTIIRATTRCLYGSRVPARCISSTPAWSDGLGLGLWTTMSDPPFSGMPPCDVRRADSSA